MVDTVLFTGQAYRIFLDEYDRHIASAATELSDVKSLNSDLCKRLSARFHTIKGGAGFFGFKEVTTHAAFLEKFFQGELAVIVSECEAARVRIEALRSLRSAMPPPAAPKAL